jgi:hypothetical protein
MHKKPINYTIEVEKSYIYNCNSYKKITIKKIIPTKAYLKENTYK